MLSPSPVVSEKTALFETVFTISDGIINFAALPFATLTNASYFLRVNTELSAATSFKALRPSASAFFLS